MPHFITARDILADRLRKLMKRGAPLFHTVEHLAAITGMAPDILGVHLLVPPPKEPRPRRGDLPP